jgi:hypothetical protein
MQRLAEVLARVAQLSSGQWGLLTAGQAECEGVPRYRLARLAEQGLLERLEHGVYAVSASQADEHRPLRAAWLALDPTRTAEERLGDLVGGGVVSHTSAAGLYGLGDLPHDIPELTLTTRRQTRRGVRLHRADLTTADVTLVDGLPTTTVERTVADLLRDGTDLDHVATVVGDGVRRGLVDRDRLSAHLQPLAHRHGDHDGAEVTERLLDLKGLSVQALERQLVNSRIGQQLVNAGALAAITRLTDAMPTPDISSLIALLNQPGSMRAAPSARET